MNIDFGRVASDYAKYRDSLPAVLFEQLADRGVSLQQKKVIDLGAGTGIFCRDLAMQGAHVVGIEPSRPLIDEAISYEQLNGVDGITYINAHAEDVDPRGTYSIVTAARAWHWFDRDKVLQNIQRYLEAQGWLIVINSIFLADSDIARTTFEVMKNHDIRVKAAGSNGIISERRSGFPVNWFEEWERYHFELVDEWEYDYLLSFSHEAWCGKIKSLSWMTDVEDTLRATAVEDLRSRLKMYSDTIQVPHRMSVVMLKKIKLS